MNVERVRLAAGKGATRVVNGAEVWLSGVKMLQDVRL